MKAPAELPCQCVLCYLNEPVCKLFGGVLVPNVWNTPTHRQIHTSCPYRNIWGFLWRGNCFCNWYSEPCDRVPSACFCPRCETDTEHIDKFQGDFIECLHFPLCFLVMDFHRELRCRGATCR